MPTKTDTNPHIEKAVAAASKTLHLMTHAANPPKARNAAYAVLDAISQIPHEAYGHVLKGGGRSIRVHKIQPKK